jgi:tetratricopeptide (TPR) repeat protein
VNLFQRIKSDWLIRKTDCLAKKGKKEEALKLLDQAGHSLNLDIQRIWLMIDTGKTKEAEELLSSAIEKNPKNPVLMMLQGETYLKLKKFEEAKNVLKETLGLSRDNIRVEYLLGQALCALGEFDQATGYFESTVKYDKHLALTRLLTFAESVLLKK